MSELQIALAAEPTTLTIAELKRDPELACRARGINRTTVREYADAMTSGATFPAVTVFRDGKGIHWLADGFHRCAAAELAGIESINAEVREGGRKDALLFAARANAAHGLRRTNADKRRAVELVLATFAKWSDRKIAEATGVDHKTVGRIRAAIGGELPQAVGRIDGEDSPANEAESRKESPYAALIARLTKTGEWLERSGEQFAERPEVQSAFSEAVTFIALIGEMIASPAPEKPRRRIVTSADLNSTNPAE